MARRILISSLLFFVTASALNFLITLLFGHATAALIHMPVYHQTNPYHFIGMVSVLFLFLQFLSFLIPITVKNLFVKYFLFYFGWILLSAVCGGLLWSYFDMRAGHFPENRVLLAKLREDAFRGLSLGSYIIFFSIPYNLMLFAVSFFLVRKIKLFTS